MRNAISTTPPRPTPTLHIRAKRSRCLGTYRASDTHQREILHFPLRDGSALVIDCEPGTLADGRLVAHITSDEPAENAQIICDLYTADVSRGRCRPVTAQDFQGTHPAPAPAGESNAPPTEPLRDDEGNLYLIRAVPTDHRAPELRWTRSDPSAVQDRFEPVSLRHLIGNLQAYEPAREITRNALADSGRHINTRRLQGELDRLAKSQVVLNRKLRQEIQRIVARGEVSMSDIAMRCGRIKRDSRGRISGETSWVSRRIGVMPEAGTEKPCPWIHSDVLGLIARDGLGICPLEIEL